MSPIGGSGWVGCEAWPESWAKANPNAGSNNAKVTTVPLGLKGAPSSATDALLCMLQVFCQNAFCRRLYNISPPFGLASSPADFQKRLGARIREIRTARGFSQEDFAEACDLHRTHVSLLEPGRINITVRTA